MKWKWFVVTVLPANMIAVHASFSCFDIFSTSAHIELHANRFVFVLSKLDRTPIWNLNSTLSLFHPFCPCLCPSDRAVVGQDRTVNFLKDDVGFPSKAMATYETGQ